MAKASAHITLTYMIDIVATYRYYLLQSSTSAKPSVPTTNPPSSTWDDTEPTYTSGSTNSLYYVDLTVFSDNSFSYSPVSLSTAYEAAKEAYNKATNAQETANNAQADINNLEIGGRNYFIRRNINNLAWGSGTLLENTAYRGYSFAVTEGEEWTVYRTDTTNNRWAFYWLTEEPVAGSTVVQAFREDEQAAYTVTKLTVPSGKTWCFIYLSNQADDIPNIMLEKGNRASDWTPALEDVEEKISDGDASVQESVTEQLTTLVQDTESIIMTALESYAEDSDLDAFKETVSTKLALLSNQLSVTISRIDTDIPVTNDRLDKLEDLLSKYFVFADDGLTISSTDSSSTLQLDNEDGVVIRKDGVIQSQLVDDNFYTGNIFIEVSKQARFGGLAAVPRSARKLTWMEVGE